MGLDAMETFGEYLSSSGDYAIPKRIEIVGAISSEREALRARLAEPSGIPSARIFFVDNPGCTCTVSSCGLLLRHFPIINVYDCSPKAPNSRPRPAMRVHGQCFHHDERSTSRIRLYAERGHWMKYLPNIEHNSKAMEAVVPSCYFAGLGADVSNQRLEHRCKGACLLPLYTWC